MQKGTQQGESIFIEVKLISLNAKNKNLTNTQFRFEQTSSLLYPFSLDDSSL